MRANPAAVAIFFALLVGCAGLPPKHTPVQLSAAAPLDGIEIPGGADWPAQDWWKRYQDATLDQLIELGGANSPSLASAHARYDSARQSVRLAAAESGAHLQANADADRQRLSDNGLFPPQLLGFTWYDQFDLGLQASYTFDWWGKQRDAVQAAMDQAHAALADRSAAALMLASSIADAYFGWQSDQNRLILAREKELAVELQAKVSGARVRADLDSADELNNADLAVATAREQIAMLEGSAKLHVVELAALVGRPVSELPPLTPKPLPSFPAALPDNVKIDLISRRADITASRWRVEAAEEAWLPHAPNSFRTSASMRCSVFPASMWASCSSTAAACHRSARRFTCRYSMRADSRRATAARRPRSRRPFRTIRTLSSTPRATWQRRPRLAPGSKPSARSARSKSTRRCA